MRLVWLILAILGAFLCIVGWARFQRRESSGGNMADQFQPVTINIAHVNVVGGPGLMLVLVVAAMVVEFPEARWLAFSGLAGGAVVGAALIAIRRFRRSDGAG